MEVKFESILIAAFIVAIQYQQINGEEELDPAERPKFKPERVEIDIKRIEKPKYVIQPYNRICKPHDDFCQLPKQFSRRSTYRDTLSSRSAGNPLGHRQFAETVLGGVQTATDVGTSINGGLEQVATGLGHVNNAGGAVFGLIQGGIGVVNSFMDLIRNGKDFLKLFGLGPMTRAFFIDNLCTMCELWVRCVSQKKDFGWIPLLFDEDLPDERQLNKMVMKFHTWLPGWEHGNAGWGTVHWTCTFKDDMTGREITMKTFGGEAPREIESYFEVRRRGVYRIDKETGRIDARQGVHFWTGYKTRPRG